MEIILYVAIFLGFTAIGLVLWALVKWWVGKYGRKSSLLNERINILSEKNRPTEAGPSVFKEAVFSQNPDFNELLKKIKVVHKLNNFILSAGAKLIVSDFLMWELILILACIFGGWILTGSLLTGLWAGVLSSLAPFVYLFSARRSRRVKLEKQLPDLLDFIARSLSAGHSFNSALQNAAQQSPEPIGPEFKMCFDQLNIGMPVREAMGNLVKRIDTDDIRFFAIAVTLNREVGGNLAELLSDVSRLIRERLTTRMVINTLTAEGRATAKFLGALPLVAILVLNLVMPGYFQPALKSSWGYQLFGMTAIWATIGFLWMRMLSNVRL